MSSCEVRVYDATGTSLQHTFDATDVTDLSWSDEVGGGGGCSFNVPGALMPTPGLLDDAVVKIAIPAPTELVEVVAYAVRGVTRVLTLGAEQVQVQGTSLLTAWGGDAVVWPEFAGTSIPRSAGEERGFSWVGSAYDPAADGDEPWDLVDYFYRAYFPTDWPTAAAADWITCTTPANGDRKMFRAWLTVAAATVIRVHFSADEASTVWVAGEAVIQTDDMETGYQHIRKVDLAIEAGTYAVAIDSVTHVSRGGGVMPGDPVLLAIAEIDPDGEPLSWLLVSNATDWVGTRRQITGPGSTPPGPTPGAILLTLAAEATARGVDTWSGITCDFTAALDSNGDAWTTTEERLQRYAFDTYGQVIEGLGDVACDCRITPDLVLQARVFEGEDRTSVAITPGENVEAESEQLTPVRATVAAAYTADGWIVVTAAGPRREVGLSLGTAPSLSQGQRIATQALEELATTRVDGDVEFIGQAGCHPYADFAVGDTVTITREGGDVQRRVLSLSGRWDRTVRWSAELGEAFA